MSKTFLIVIMFIAGIGAIIWYAPVIPVGQKFYIENNLPCTQNCDDAGVVYTKTTFETGQQLYNEKYPKYNGQPAGCGVVGCWSTDAQGNKYLNGELFPENKSTSPEVESTQKSASITTLYGGLDVDEAGNFDQNTIKNWETSNIKDYQAEYDFGFSESESNLTLDFSNNDPTAVIRKDKWDGKTWVPIYDNLKNVKIIGNKFYSDSYQGEFVKFTFNNELKYGLLLYGYIDKDRNEIGFRNL